MRLRHYSNLLHCGGVGAAFICTLRRERKRERDREERVRQIENKREREREREWKQEVQFLRYPVVALVV